MKKIIAEIDVKDAEAEAAVTAAHQQLPGWNVRSEDTEDTEGIEGIYRSRLVCTNCRYVWVGTFEVGTRIPDDIICSNCACRTGMRG